MILEETGELFSQLSEAGYEPRICATHGVNPCDIDVFNKQIAMFRANKP